MDAETDAAMPPALVRQPVMPLVALHGMTDLHAALLRHMPLIRAVDLAQLPHRVAKARRSSFEGHVPQGVRECFRDLGGSSVIVAFAVEMYRQRRAVRLQRPLSVLGPARLKVIIAAAKEAGLDTLLLAQFGAGGVEGSDGAAEVAARVGAGTDHPRGPRPHRTTPNTHNAPRASGA